MTSDNVLMTSVVLCDDDINSAINNTEMTSVVMAESVTNISAQDATGDIVTSRSREEETARIGVQIAMRYGFDRSDDDGHMTDGPNEVSRPRLPGERTVSVLHDAVMSIIMPFLFAFDRNESDSLADEQNMPFNTGSFTNEAMLPEIYRRDELLSPAVSDANGFGALLDIHADNIDISAEVDENLRNEYISKTMLTELDASVADKPDAKIIKISGIHADSFPQVMNMQANVSENTGIQQHVHLLALPTCSSRDNFSIDRDELEKAAACDGDKVVEQNGDNSDVLMKLCDDILIDELTPTVVLADTITSKLSASGPFASEEINPGSFPLSGSTPQYSELDSDVAIGLSHRISQEKLLYESDESLAKVGVGVDMSSGDTSHHSDQKMDLVSYQQLVAFEFPVEPIAVEPNTIFQVSAYDRNPKLRLDYRCQNLLLEEHDFDTFARQRYMSMDLSTQVCDKNLLPYDHDIQHDALKNNNDLSTVTQVPLQDISAESFRLDHEKLNVLTCDQDMSGNVQAHNVPSDIYVCDSNLSTEAATWLTDAMVSSQDVAADDEGRNLKLSQNTIALGQDMSTELLKCKEDVQPVDTTKRDNDSSLKLHSPGEVMSQKLIRAQHDDISRILMTHTRDVPPNMLIFQQYISTEALTHQQDITSAAQPIDSEMSQKRLACDQNMYFLSCNLNGLLPEVTSDNDNTTESLLLDQDISRTNPTQDLNMSPDVFTNKDLSDDVRLFHHDMSVPENVELGQYTSGNTTAFSSDMSTTAQVNEACVMAETLEDNQDVLPHYQKISHNIVAYDEDMSRNAITSNDYVDFLEEDPTMSEIEALDEDMPLEQCQSISDKFDSDDVDSDDSTYSSQASDINKDVCLIENLWKTDLPESAEIMTELASDTFSKSVADSSSYTLATNGAWSNQINISEHVKTCNIDFNSDNREQSSFFGEVTFGNGISSGSSQILPVDNMSEKNTELEPHVSSDLFNLTSERYTPAETSTGDQNLSNDGSMQSANLASSEALVQELRDLMSPQIISPEMKLIAYSRSDLLNDSPLRSDNDGNSPQGYTIILDNCMSLEIDSNKCNKSQVQYCADGKLPKNLHHEERDVDDTMSERRSLQFEDKPMTNTLEINYTASAFERFRNVSLDTSISSNENNSVVSSKDPQLVTGISLLELEYDGLSENQTNFSSCSKNSSSDFSTSDENLLSSGIISCNGIEQNESIQIKSREHNTSLGMHETRAVPHPQIDQRGILCSEPLRSAAEAFPFEATNYVQRIMTLVIDEIRGEYSQHEIFSQDLLPNQLHTECSISLTDDLYVDVVNEPPISPIDGEQRLAGLYDRMSVFDLGVSPVKSPTQKYNLDTSSKIYRERLNSKPEDSAVDLPVSSASDLSCKNTSQFARIPRCEMNTSEELQPACNILFIADTHDNLGENENYQNYSPLEADASHDLCDDYRSTQKSCNEDATVNSAVSGCDFVYTRRPCIDDNVASGISNFHVTKDEPSDTDDRTVYLLQQAHSDNLLTKDTSCNSNNDIAVNDNTYSQFGISVDHNLKQKIDECASGPNEKSIIENNGSRIDDDEANDYSDVDDFLSDDEHDDANDVNRDLRLGENEMLNLSSTSSHNIVRIAPRVSTYVSNRRRVKLNLDAKKGNTGNRNTLSYYVKYRHTGLTRETSSRSIRHKAHRVNVWNKCTKCHCNKRSSSRSKNFPLRAIDAWNGTSIDNSNKPKQGRANETLEVGTFCVRKGVRHCHLAGRSQNIPNLTKNYRSSLKVTPVANQLVLNVSKCCYFWQASDNSLTLRPWTPISAGSPSCPLCQEILECVGAVDTEQTATVEYHTDNHKAEICSELVGNEHNSKSHITIYSTSNSYSSHTDCEDAQGVMLDQTQPTHVCDSFEHNAVVKPQLSLLQVDASLIVPMTIMMDEKKSDDVIIDHTEFNIRSVLRHRCSLELPDVLPVDKVVSDSTCAPSNEKYWNASSPADYKITLQQLDKIDDYTSATDPYLKPPQNISEDSDICKQQTEHSECFLIRKNLSRQKIYLKYIEELVETSADQSGHGIFGNQLIMSTTERVQQRNDAITVLKKSETAVMDNKSRDSRPVTRFCDVTRASSCSSRRNVTRGTSHDRLSNVKCFNSYGSSCSDMTRVLSLSRGGTDADERQKMKTMKKTLSESKFPDRPRWRY